MKTIRLAAAVTVVLTTVLAIAQQAVPGALSKEQIGSVVAVRGTVSITGIDSQTRQAQTKGPVYLGDRVVTDSRSRIQLVFTDKTIVSLGADTAADFAEYVYDPDNKRAAMTTRVSNGVFRVMGGAITKLAPEKFRTVTPTASIGIRGSFYMGSLLQGVLKVVFLGGKGIYVFNDFGRLDIAVPSDGVVVKPGAKPEPMRFTVQEMRAMTETHTGTDEEDGGEGEPPPTEDPAEGPGDGNEEPPADDGDTKPTPEQARVDPTSTGPDGDTGPGVGDNQTESSQSALTQTTEQTAEETTEAIPLTGYYAASTVAAEQANAENTRYGHGPTEATSQARAVTGEAKPVDQTSNIWTVPFAFPDNTASGTDTTTSGTRTGRELLSAEVSGMAEHTVTVPGPGTADVSYVYTIDDAGEFAFFQAVNVPALFDDQDEFLFSELGFAGAAAADGGEPADQVALYRGSALGLAFDTLNSLLTPQPETIETTVNFHTGKVIGVPVVTVDVGRGGSGPEWFFFGDRNGDQLNVTVAGSAAAFDPTLAEGAGREIPVAVSGSGTGTFYGSEWQGLGLAATGFDATGDNVTAVWDLVGAQQLVETAAAPTGGIMDIQGSAVGIAESTDTDASPLLMSDPGNGLALKLNSIEGTVSGGFGLSDAQALDMARSPGGHITTIGPVAVGAGYAGSALLSDTMFVGDVSAGDSAVLVGVNRSAGPLAETGNVLKGEALSNLPDAETGAAILPDWVHWGNFQLAYTDPLGGEATHVVHDMGGLWAGAEDRVADLATLSEASAVYRAAVRAVGTIVDANGHVDYEPMWGKSRFDIDLGSDTFSFHLGLESNVTGGYKLYGTGTVETGGLTGSVHALDRPGEQVIIPAVGALTAGLYDDPAKPGVDGDRLLGTFATDLLPLQGIEPISRVAGVVAGGVDTGPAMVGRYLGAILEPGPGTSLVGETRADSIDGVVVGTARAADVGGNTWEMPLAFATTELSPETAYVPRDIVMDPSTWESKGRVVSLPEAGLHRIPFEHTNDSGPGEFAVFRAHTPVGVPEDERTFSELGYAGIPAQSGSMPSADGVYEYAGPAIKVADAADKSYRAISQTSATTLVNFRNGCFVGFPGGTDDSVKRPATEEDLDDGFYFGRVTADGKGTATFLGSGGGLGDVTSGPFAESGTGTGMFFGSQWQGLGLSAAGTTGMIGGNDVAETWEGVTGQLLRTVHSSISAEPTTRAGFAVAIADDISDPFGSGTPLLMSESGSNFTLATDPTAGTVSGTLSLDDVATLAPPLDGSASDTVFTVGALQIGGATSDSAYVNDDLFAAVLTGETNAVSVATPNGTDSGALDAAGSFLLSRKLGARHVSPLAEWALPGTFELAFVDPTGGATAYHVHEPNALWLAADGFVDDIATFPSLTARYEGDASGYRVSADAAMTVHDALAGSACIDVNFSHQTFAGYVGLTDSDATRYMLTMDGQVTAEGLSGRVLSISRSSLPYPDMPSLGAFRGGFFDDEATGDTQLDRVLGVFAAELGGIRGGGVERFFGGLTAGNSGPASMSGSYLGLLTDAGMVTDSWRGPTSADRYDDLILGTAHVTDADGNASDLPFMLDAGSADENASYILRDIERDDSVWKMTARVIDVPGVGVTETSLAYALDEELDQFAVLLTDSLFPGDTDYVHFLDLSYVGVPADGSAQPTDKVFRYTGLSLRLAEDATEGIAVSDGGRAETTVNFANDRSIGMIEAGGMTDSIAVRGRGSMLAPTVFFGTVDGNLMTDVTFLGSGSSLALSAVLRQEPGAVSVWGTGNAGFYGSDWQGLGLTGDGGADYLSDGTQAYTWQALAGQMLTGTEDAPATGSRVIDGFAVGASDALTDPFGEGSPVLMTSGASQFEMDVDVGSGTVSGTMALEDTRVLDPNAGSPTVPITSVNNIQIGGGPQSSAAVSGDLYAAFLSGDATSVSVEYDASSADGPLGASGNHLMSASIAGVPWPPEGEAEMPEWVSWGGFELAYANPLETGSVHHLHSPMSLWLAAEDLTADLSSAAPLTGIYDGPARGTRLVVDEYSYGFYDSLWGHARVTVDFADSAFSGHLSLANAGADSCLMAIEGNVVTSGIEGGVTSIDTLWGNELLIPATSAVRGAFYDNTDDTASTVDRLLGIFAADVADSATGVLKERYLGGFASEGLPASSMTGAYGAGLTEFYGTSTTTPARASSGEAWLGSTEAGSYNGTILGTAFTTDTEDNGKVFPFAFGTTPLTPDGTYAPRAIDTDGTTWDGHARFVDVPDGNAVPMPFASTYDAGIGEFALFTARDAFLYEDMDYGFAELGYAGVPALSADMPQSGVAEYRGPALTIWGDTYGEMVATDPGEANTFVNFHNGRVIGYLERSSDNPAYWGAGGDNNNMATHSASSLYYGAKGDSTDGLRVVGPESSPGIAEVPTGSGEVAFYGASWQALGVGLGGATISLRDSYQLEKWDALSGQLATGQSDPAKTGTIELNGFAAGAAFEMYGYNSLPTLLATPSGADLDLTIDRDEGSIVGSLSLKDARALGTAGPGTGVATTAIADVAIGGATAADSAYVSGEHLVASLNGASASVTVSQDGETMGQGPANTIGSVLVGSGVDSDDNGVRSSAAGLPEWATWGYWRLSYADPADVSVDHDVSSDAALWVAADGYVADATAVTGFNATYTGGARMAHVALELGQVVTREDLDGSVVLDVQFRGTNTTFSGAIDFDSYSLSTSGAVTPEGLSGGIDEITAAPSSETIVPDVSTIRGGFFETAGNTLDVPDRAAGAFAAEVLGTGPVSQVIETFTGVFAAETDQAVPAP